MFLRRLFGLVPPDPFTEGLQLVQKGELRAALALFEPLLESPDEAIRKMASLYACEALLQLGDEIVDTDPAAGLECYESASGLQPTFADIKHRIGRLRMERGDLERAERALRTALSINEYFFAARLDLLEVSLRQGSQDPLEALAEFEHHIPPMVAVDAAAVREHVVANNVEAALARILAIREHSPDPRDHVKQRAITALQNDQPERAIEMLEGMMKGGRRFPDLLHVLGLAYSGLDRHSDAEDCFREAIAIHPGYAKARVNLALSLMDQDRWSEAESELETLLVQEPNHPLALMALDEIRAQVGKD